MSVKLVRTHFERRHSCANQCLILPYFSTLGRFMIIQLFLLHWKAHVRELWLWSVCVSCIGGYREINLTEGKRGKPATNANWLFHTKTGDQGLTRKNRQTQTHKTHTNKRKDRRICRESFPLWSSCGKRLGCLALKETCWGTLIKVWTVPMNSKRQHKVYQQSEMADAILFFCGVGIHLHWGPLFRHVWV